MQEISYTTNAAPKEIKGTAVDSVNTDIEQLTHRVHSLAEFAGRISDGILGVSPEKNGSTATPRPVTLSTQDHVRDLGFAIGRLSDQLNRLS